MRIIRINYYDFTHDTNGNPTAHFEVWENGEIIHKSKRRKQIGYSGYEHSGARVYVRDHILDEHEDLRLIEKMETNRNGTNSREYEVVTAKMSIIPALKLLKKGKIPNPRCGICHNLVIFGAIKYYSELNDAFKAWEYYEKAQTFAFPIEVSLGYSYDTPATVCWDKKDMYGKRRHHLVDHLIKYFTENPK